MILAKAQSLIKQYGGVTERARREFARWIDDQSDFSGGERAYRFINDDGRVYQSVAMGAPEPRTDPKFYIPLVHPITKKECPVPSNGWSRAPETLQELIDKGEYRSLIMALETLKGARCTPSSNNPASQRKNS